LALRARHRGSLTNLVERLYRRIRPRRVDVGTYEDPEPQSWPTVERQIDEGVLIAASATRMAVANGLIERILRDGFNYDERRLRLAVQAQLLALARENEEDAERIGETRDLQRSRGYRGAAADRDAPRLQRRIDVSRGLAARLREVSTDEAAVSELAERAREAALGELAVSVELSSRSLKPRTDIVQDVGRDTRDHRMRSLREELAALTDGQDSLDA
jgi:hypothetical protein